MLSDLTLPLCATQRPMLSCVSRKAGDERGTRAFSAPQQETHLHSGVVGFPSLAAVPSTTVSCPHFLTSPDGRSSSLSTAAGACATLFAFRPQPQRLKGAPVGNSLKTTHGPRFETRCARGNRRNIQNAQSDRSAGKARGGIRRRYNHE